MQRWTGDAEHRALDDLLVMGADLERRQSVRDELERDGTGRDARSRGGGGRKT
jgi:hypothetical protein